MLTDRLKDFFGWIGVEWVMYLLLVLSVISVVIMVERVLFYRRVRVDVDALGRALLSALDAGDREAAIAAALRRPSMEGRVMAEGIRAIERGPAAVEEVIRGALTTERAAYDRYLAFLGTLGNNAPFIGLFGTVLGIISAFGALSEVTRAAERANAMMGSISEALVATAVGRLVAIPAVIAFNQFKGIIRQRSADAEALGHVLLAHLKTRDDG